MDISRRLDHRFCHIPSKDAMLKSRRRRTVPRASEVCAEGVCRGFSDRAESVLRTLINELVQPGLLHVEEGEQEDRRSGWLVRRWQSGGYAIPQHRCLFALAVGELSTSSGTTLRCLATSIVYIYSVAVILASWLYSLDGRRL